MSEETSDVRDAHRFDEAALERYLGEHIEGFQGPLEVKQFKGGQSNPTFFLNAGSRRYVLRKKPPGKLLPSAHAIEREYRVMKALASTAVPVAQVLTLCEDSSIIGTPFYVMEHLDGRIFRNPLMPDARGKAERGQLVRVMVETLAKLHAVDYQAVGLGDYGKPGNYMQRQIGRWSKQYEASKTDEIQAMSRLMAWLPENVPAGDETSIAHGDFRLENLIIHPSEPKVLAVLDWELSTLGHPLADLGYNLMLYHLPTGDFSGSGYMGANLDEFGIPSREECVKIYCEVTGRDGVPDLDYFIAFGMFRLAAICQGVYKRGLDGNASSTTALRYGAVAQALAQIGADLVNA